MTDFDMPELNADEALKILRSENIEVPVVLISALKINEATKKDFQGFLQKPVDEDVFLKEMARFLKHDTVLIEEEEIEIDSYDFVIPDNLNGIEIKLIQEINEKLQTWRNFMPISEIENEIPVLKGKLMEQSAGTFNIELTKVLLDHAIKQTKK